MREKDGRDDDEPSARFEKTERRTLRHCCGATGDGELPDDIVVLIWEQWQSKSGPAVGSNSIQPNRGSGSVIIIAGCGPP